MAGHESNSKTIQTLRSFSGIIFWHLNDSDTSWRSNFRTWSNDSTAQIFRIWRLSSVFGLCNFSGKNRPCIYMFAMNTNGFQITRVLSKEVLEHTKYEFYLPQMELSTARLIFVKWIILVISTFSWRKRIRFRLPVPSFSAPALRLSWWYIRMWIVP